MNRFFSLLILVCIFFNASAQDEFVFRQGLIIKNAHQYSRQAVNTDQLSWRLFSEKYRKPEAGMILFRDNAGNDAAWQEIRSDSSGLFTVKEPSNQYIYLIYNSPREQAALVNITGDDMFYLNGQPHAGDPYDASWLYIPVKLRKGINEFYVRSSKIIFEGLKARLIFPEKPVFISNEDPTLPSVIPGNENSSLTGAAVIINTSGKQVSGLSVRSVVQGKEVITGVPSIMPYSSRKVPFRFDASGVKEKGKVNCRLTLISGGSTIAETDIEIESVNADEPYKVTFTSDIDGSVQYYAVNPQIKGSDSKALILTVHGAGVEAIGQARAYKPKDWGVLVAPTNRRPRGFNWEDWGRIDALEVLRLAVEKFNPEPSRIYLTGHSMGGHGTWYLGATFPGKWAAIAPCAGYPTLQAYGSADGKIPAPVENSLEQTILRASNGSNVPELVRNYGAAGVYVLHGDADSTVSVEYARQMRQLLGAFHSDFSYYEYPGGSHWWSNESVDWAPLFSYLKWHTIVPDSSASDIDFTTANTAVSSSLHWASILQQKESLKYSRIKLHIDKTKGLITGSTENTAVLRLDLSLIKGDSVSLNIDGEPLRMKKPTEQYLYLSRKNSWQPGNEPESDQKGKVRNGTFKEPFSNRMVFVYGTSGTREENDWALAKARYDSEIWYYRGNGAIDIISDKDFHPSDYPDRGIIIYGNSASNSAWKVILSECPIEVARGKIVFGDKVFTGNNYGAYIMYPRKDSKTASVAAVAGTGTAGMHATDASQYFAGGSGFPDYMIFSSDMLEKGVEGVVSAGYYDNEWKLGVISTGVTGNR